ncbi:hypothetical protein [Flavobacterium sp.]|uniref:hypothetical protein n=1 Tax=Flavobacterium sp. TaxID=239 RepID=UPI0039E34114
MRKLLFAFSAFLLLISCSSDDDSSSKNNPNGTRLTKSVLVFSSGSSSTSVYTYNGAQLSKITDSSGDYVNYSYNAQGLIGSWQNYTAGGSLRNSGVLEYDSQDRIIHGQFYNANGSTSSLVYVYDDVEDKVTITIYEGAELPANITRVDYVYFEDGEVIKKVATSPTETYDVTYGYEFDSMNNPNKSIPGFFAAFFYGSFGATNIGNAHNLSHITQTAQSQSSSYGYEFEYNAYGYPTVATQVNQNGQPNGNFRYYYYE